MTINDVAELDLSHEGLKAAMYDVLGADGMRRIEDLPGVMSSVRGIMELEPADRAVVLRTIRGFVCGECGEPSCLHGYPDD